MDLFVAADIVGVAEMVADELRVLGEGSTADGRGFARGYPLAGKGRVGVVIGGRDRDGGGGGWGWGWGCMSDR